MIRVHFICATKKTQEEIEVSLQSVRLPIDKFLVQLNDNGNALYSYDDPSLETDPVWKKRHEMLVNDLSD